MDHAYTLIVGDRPRGHGEALRFLAARGIDVIVTSGGLGPTADDLTAEVVGAFAAREMVLDEALEERIAEILRPLLSRWPELDAEAMRGSNRKQAVVPQGATVLEPVGTAPGLVVPPARVAARRSSCCPGRRASCSRCGPRPRTEAFRAARGRRGELPPGDAAAVRDPRVGDRRDAAASPRTAATAWRGWRSPPACAAARSRS